MICRKKSGGHPASNKNIRRSSYRKGHQLYILLSFDSVRALKIHDVARATSCIACALELSVHQKLGFSGDRILKRSCTRKKSHLQQGGQIARLIFVYGNSSFSIRIFTESLYASLIKKKKFNIADHYRLSLIG